MSSVRVDSPLLSEFRRQPSPCVPTMPKPRACRKLFPVDHAETNSFLQTEIAQIDAEQQAQMGFDLGKCVPLEDQSSSRYTNWEAMPAESVPSFYRETVPRKRNRLRQPERLSTTPRQNKIDSRIHPLHTNEADGTAVVLKTHSTVRDHSFVPLHRLEASNNSKQNSIASVTLSSKTDDTIPSISETSSERKTICKAQRHGSELAVTTSIPSTATSVVDKQQMPQTQSKVTDYFRQRKRCGSSEIRISSGTDDGGKHPVPTKRRMGTNSPTDGGDTLPEVGQS
ncbi:uncharacterized protein [Asterias amurensis]|uniref:uncharacterized protein n=1 Tax=Asterias amurensis TaxID=7602 RepID=UPI003AB7F119